MMILLSGMHLSFATHICDGELAATKWSLSDEKATCGMKCDTEKHDGNYSFSSEECQDQQANFVVDNNYNSTTIQNNAPTIQLLEVFYIPTTIGSQFFNSNSSINTNVQPPGNFLASAVSLPDVCVFRI